MADDTPTDETLAPPSRGWLAGGAREDRIDVVAGRLGFHRWHLPVVLVAGLATAWTAVAADPIGGTIGSIAALIVWASVVKVLQGLNAFVVRVLGDRRPGIMTVRLYSLAVLVGLASVSIALFLQSPSPWSRLIGRYTPEIAIYGFFVLGTLLAVVFAVVKSTVLFASQVVRSGE